MEQELRFEIKPRFSFLYELVMPLGIKLRRSLIILLILTIAMVLTNIFGPKVNFDTEILGTNLISILNIFYIVLMGITFIKFIVDLILKIMQYKKMSYKFYEDHLIYEDKFLNQQKKIIKYENIKEIEIRRSVWDRIMGYGIIIISTNAEGGFRSGLIIYGINNSDQVYEKINELVHTSEKQIKKEENIDYGKDKIEEQVKDLENNNTSISEENEEEFKNSLKNIK